MINLTIENIGPKEKALIEEWCELRARLNTDLLKRDFDQWEALYQRYEELTPRVSTILLVSTFIQHQETGL